MRFRPPLLEIPGDDPFKFDLLDRKNQIEALTRLVENVEGPCVLAIDGAWGAGKTVFLKLWAQALIDRGFRVVEFNAWETDFSDDPLMALYSELEETLPKSDDDTVLFDAGARMISQIASTVLRTDVMAAIEKSQEKTKKATRRRVELYRETRVAIEDFKEELAKTVGSGKPVVVCVDELDRCRPDYAIRFLEATKHIFEVEGVMFLLAVNLSELAKSVRALYGADFDGQHYLTRFVDQVLHLQTDRSRYMKHLLERYGLTNLGGAPYFHGLEGYLETFVLGSARITLRDLEQGIRHLGMVIASLPPKPRALTHATVMMILRMVVPDTYRKLIRGEISDLEALQALNKRIDRPDDWWQTATRHSPSWGVSPTLENILIHWYRFIRGNNSGSTPLLDLRKSEAGEDDKEENYASQVISGTRWSDSSQIKHAQETVELITYDPQE